MKPTLLRDVLLRYAATPLRTRLHVYGRLRSVPVEPILAALPRAGHIAAIGCGHGALEIAACLDSSERRFSAGDIDAAKLAHLSAAAAGLPLRVIAGDVLVQAEEPFDAVLIVDVLYLRPPEAQLQVLRAAFAALRSGGSIVIKEMDTRPRTKALWNRMQEFLALRVFRITAHQAGTCGLRPSAEQLADLAAAGFVLGHAEPLHGGWLHPHLLLTARKP